MSDANTAASGGGVGFTGLLTILFIGLKLTGYIDWSWWWVVSPVWITAGVVVTVVAVALLVALFVRLVESLTRP